MLIVMPNPTFPVVPPADGVVRPAGTANATHAWIFEVGTVNVFLIFKNGRMIGRFRRSIQIGNPCRILFKLLALERAYSKVIN